MPFLTGNVTFFRFAVRGARPDLFGDDHLDALRQFAAGRSRLASADGVECGWAASGHVLDTDFTLLKNVVNDALCFDLRVDTDRLPADLLKAYYEIELKALSASNPSGFASAKQKREAKEAARDRLEEEAKDGRFKKRKCIPLLWDRPSNELLFGATSVTHVDRLCALFKQTFDAELMPLTAGVQSRVRGDQAHARLHGEQAGYVTAPTLSPFVEGVTPEDAAWIPDGESRDFLGNEFLLWLWFNADGASDTLALPDKSDATFMIARTLVLDCPRGQSGTDGFRHEGPTRLPEALRALRAGKLPRKCGLTLVRHDEQYEFTLHAETLSVGGCKLPKPGDDVTDARAKLDDRIDKVRHQIQTLDLLYAAFLAVRLSLAWAETLGRMQRWLSKGERREAA